MTNLQQWYHNVNDEQMKVLDLVNKQSYLVTVYNPSVLPLLNYAINSNTNDIKAEKWDPIS